MELFRKSTLSDTSAMKITTTIYSFLYIRVPVGRPVATNIAKCDGAMVVLVEPQSENRMVVEHFALLAS